MTLRTVRDAFAHLAEQAQRKATGETLLHGADAGGPWRHIAGFFGEWTGWCTLPPEEGQEEAAPRCAFEGRAHAGHVRWALEACLRVATAAQEADPLNLRAWTVEQLLHVPVVADDRATPALWLWSLLARQAQAQAQALPQPVQSPDGQLGVMRGQLFVPVPVHELQQIRGQAMHLAQVREGLVGDLGMMLEYLNPAPPRPPARHLRAVPAPRGQS